MNKHVTAITDEAQKAMLTYSWPGNVRELKHVVQQAVLLSANDAITEDTLMLSKGCSHPATNLKEKKDGIEKEHYEKVLEVFGGNVTSTAKSMGISRSTMYRKMKNHGIKHIRKLK